MTTRFNVLLVLLGLLAACATNPSKFTELLDSDSTVVITQKKDMLTATEIMPLPTTIHGMSFRRKSFKLTETDPLFDFGDYKGNFKVFSFSLEEDDEFVITVQPLPLGLTHKMLGIVRNVLILTESAEEISTEKSAEQNAFGDYYYKGASRGAGTYYLVVAADNSSMGERIKTFSGTTAAGGMAIEGQGNIISNPFGTFFPSIEIVEK